VGTGENFHQRTFTGAVFAHQSPDLTCPNGKIDILEGRDTAEGFGDVDHLNRFLIVRVI
jgi:hypothetical protein